MADRDPNKREPESAEPGDGGRLSDWALTFFGMVLAITPLAMWVAWSPEVLVYVILVGIAGLLVCCGLSVFSSARKTPIAPGSGPIVVPFRPPPDRGMTELFRPYSPANRIAYLKLVWQHRRLSTEIFVCLVALGLLMIYLAMLIIRNNLLSVVP